MTARKDNTSQDVLGQGSNQPAAFWVTRSTVIKASKQWFTRN